MKRALIICFFLTQVISTSAQTYKSDSPLAHTYSIVAYDSAREEIGVAVQSHWFSVGSLVAWGEGGVGVIATQSFVNPSFGPRGLDLLKKGKSPQEVVDELIKSDDGREVRQLAICDSKGNVAAWTGQNCIKSAGHITGKNFSVQANMMLNEKVWPKMAETFEKSKGPLAERLLDALDGAEKAGGDIRGKQSAVILVFKAKSQGKPWEDKLVDLRVDDNPLPLKEMRRLLNVHRAYEFMNNGDLAVEKNDMDSAMKEYSSAMKMFPKNLEMKYWTAVALVNKGMIQKALPIFKEVFKKDKNWKVLTSRLVPIGLLIADPKQMRTILKQ